MEWVTKGFFVGHFKDQIGTGQLLGKVFIPEEFPLGELTKVTTELEDL